MNIFVKSQAAPQQGPRDSRKGFDAWRRRIVMALPLCATALALTIGSNVSTAAGASAGNTPLPPRLYVITPSSEPGNITGPSVIKIYDPTTLTPTLVKQIPAVGLKPHHLYKIPDRNIAFIAHFAPTAHVEVLDLVKDEVVGTIPTGVGPRHMGFTPNGSFAYTANFDDNTITRINTNSLKSKTAPAHGIRPNYVEYIETPNGPLVFTTNFGENTVSVLHPQTLALIKKITVGSKPFNLSSSAACECIMTANSGDNTVSWIDMNTLEEVDRQSILTSGTVLNTSQSQRANPRISPDGKFLWVGNHQGSEFAVFNIFTHQLVATIPAGFGADIAFFPRSGPGAGYAFMTNRYDYFVTVAKLNGPNPPTFVKNIPTTLQGSHFFNFNEDFSKGYVSLRPGGGCSVIDMTTQTEVASLSTGGGPDQCTYYFSNKGKVVGYTESSVAK